MGLFLPGREGLGDEARKLLLAAREEMGSGYHLERFFAHQLAVDGKERIEGRDVVLGAAHEGDLSTEGAKRRSVSSMPTSPIELAYLCAYGMQG